MATTNIDETTTRRGTTMQELDSLRITEIGQIMNGYNTNIRHFLTLCSQVNGSRMRERLRRPRDIFSINYEFHPDITSLGLGTWRTAAAAAAAAQEGSVSIAPLTLQEITGGTRVYSYVANEETEVCPITHIELQENDSVCQIRGCLHIFKYDAIMQWFTTNTTCPVCRYSLRGSGSPAGGAATADAATATTTDNNEALLQLIRAFFPSVGNNESTIDIDNSLSTFMFPNASSFNRRSI